MSGYFILAILALAFLVTFQIAKASEYVSVLKGEEKTFQQNNRINAFLFIVFLVLGLIGAWWCNELFYKKTLLAQPAASDHGEKIDTMLWWTIIVTGVVFFLTQILLFWFAFKYQYTEKRKAYFFAHSNKLELIWTVVPAIFLTILVGMGLFYWFKITGDAPKGDTLGKVSAPTRIKHAEDGTQFASTVKPGDGRSIHPQHLRFAISARTTLGIRPTGP
jgi:cytochrome c oxidase subunit 2